MKNVNTSINFFIVFCLLAIFSFWFYTLGHSAGMSKMTRMAVGAGVCTFECDPATGRSWFVFAKSSTSDAIPTKLPSMKQKKKEKIIPDAWRGVRADGVVDK